MDADVIFMLDRRKEGFLCASTQNPVVVTECYGNLITVGISSFFLITLGLLLNRKTELPAICIPRITRCDWRIEDLPLHRHYRYTRVHLLNTMLFDRPSSTNGDAGKGADFEKEVAWWPDGLHPTPLHGTGGRMDIFGSCGRFQHVAASVDGELAG
ncbi:hypothetical protein EDD16DRAFT_1679867 [Pisolithus croceorrhizus]|nr:hypothetical protein EDD16DRAFT_1679867 [Pisolithus croceorrhizus]